MENNKELNDLIKDIRSKLPSDVTIELIGDDDIARETQSKPGQALSDELLAKISQAAEAAAKEIFGDTLETVQTEIISPLDGSPEAAQAFREMLRNRFGLQRPQCYHYILKDGKPTHTEDAEEVARFVESKGYIVAEDSFVYRHLKMKITTFFAVHNPWTGGEPPRPRWVTQLIKADDGDIGAQEITYSADEALAHHNIACEAMRRQLAEHKQHRFAKGLDAWRRKLEGTDE